jgi:hypothetical protein
VDSTVLQLYAELGTPANDVKSPPLSDPHQEEPACRVAIERAMAVVT